MKKLSFIFAFFFACMLLSTDVFSREIEIQVSPHILNLQSNGVVITVHTDIYYWNVEASTVNLNGIAIQSCKADNRGFFVAKFNRNEVKTLNLVVGEYNTLTLQGLTSLGELFSGSQDILILNNKPASKK